MRTSVKYLVIYRHKDKYTISEMCRFFDVSRSGYYDYVKRMELPDRDLPLAEQIRTCQQEVKQTYGYRRVHIWLERKGIYRNPKTILRIMQKYNLLSAVRRKRYQNYGDVLSLYSKFCLKSNSAASIKIFFALQPVLAEVSKNNLIL